MLKVFLIFRTFLQMIKILIYRKIMIEKILLIYIPNILILNSNIRGMDYIKMIEFLSSLPDEKHKSNIILILNKLEDHFLLRNVSKVYAISKSNFNKNEMLETIPLMFSKFKTPALTLDEFRIYLFAV